MMIVSLFNWDGNGLSLCLWVSWGAQVGSRWVGVRWVTIIQGESCYFDNWRFPFWTSPFSIEITGSVGRGKGRRVLMYSLSSYSSSSSSSSSIVLSWSFIAWESNGFNCLYSCNFNNEKTCIHTTDTCTTSYWIKCFI